MRTVSKLKKTLLITFSVVLLLAGLATVGVYSQRATYTITDGTNDSQVTTWKGTVAQVLNAADIPVSEHDLVTPALDQQVSEGTQIKITRASAYQVQVGDKTTEIFSTAANYQGILESANYRQVSLPLSRTANLPLLKAAGKLTVKDGKQETALELSSTDTLATVLEKAKLQLSAIDELALTSAEGKLSLDIIRVTRGEVSEQIEIPFETEVRETARLYEGQERVIAEGAKGATKVTYYRHIRGGKTIVDKEISRITAVEAQPRIVEKGTAKRPRENQNASRGQIRENAPVPVATAVSGDIWAALAQCESGGNPATNTGNGYYGMYQFSLPTWQAVGGVGLPSQASAAEQTMRAQILQARAGWGQWPACARKLGLL